MKLSIITINFNDKNGLEKTISSVKEQVYSEFNFLIIDGGSTDGSLDVLKNYDSDIDFWLSEPDSGIYNAMNKGIKRASGDYVLFLNSGDILNGPEALEKFIHHKEFEGDIVYGDYKFEKGGKVYPDKLSPLQFFKSSLPHQSTFIRRKLFSEFGLYNEELKIVSDWEFFIKCFLSNKVFFKHVNYPLSVFDLNGVSNSTKHKELHDKERNIVLKEYFGIFYSDYEVLVQLEAGYNRVKRKSLKGIFKRIKNKLLS